MSRRTILRGAIIPVWEKFTANTIDLVVGSSSDDVTDLRNKHDDNLYTLTEVSASPGQDLIIDFVDVPVFNYVRALSNYQQGPADLPTHFVQFQLFRWLTSVWDVWDSESNAAGIQNHSFFVQDPESYIGQGVNSGRVRARYSHPVMGNINHQTVIDEISLFRFT